MRERRTPQPLDESKLNELALRYVGRFATSRAKLVAYLKRKIRERGWSGERTADAAAMAERFAALGYIDDAGFALARSRALTGRGYGKRRVSEALRSAGIDETDGEAARDHADAEAVASALRFAERRKIGPFGTKPVTDPKERQRLLAAMIRAGHGFAIARAIVALGPGSPVEPEALAERDRSLA